MGHPQLQVDYLDLALSPPPHLSMEALGFRTGQQADTAIERQENAFSELLVTQFLSADVVIVGAPLYNFSVPSQLKAWLDRIAQVGRTFHYTSAGPVGLATNKIVIVASSRGGVYSASPEGRAMEIVSSILISTFYDAILTNLHISMCIVYLFDRMLANQRLHVI